MNRCPSILLLASLVLAVPARGAVAPRARGGSADHFDCNANGIDDSVDIAMGSSADLDQNGVPDECEPRGQGLVTGSTGGGT